MWQAVGGGVELMEGWMMDVVCACLLIADALAAGDGLDGFGSRCSIIDFLC